MKNKKEVILFTIVIIALLIITIGGLTFAYFASNINNKANLNLDVSTANNMYTFVSNTNENDNIEFNINFNEMSEASANNSTPVKSDTANINVSLTSVEGSKTTCTYDIVWVWDSNDKYTEADVDELPYIHEATGITYNYEFSTKVDEDKEIDLSTLDLIDTNKVTLKSNASIIAIGKEIKSINHEITAKIYNLPVDQPNLFNKSFKAHIQIENVNCKMEKIETIADFIKKLYDNNSDVGDGELIKHTEDIETSAGDGGYRYSGNQPNNYICFGAGSEGYNSGTEETCPTTNKYRIIGYVPVVKSDNTTENLLKIIKAEYLTPAELGREEKDGTVSSYSSYTKYARIEADPTTLDGFYWHTSSNNTWGSSSLYNSLNDDTSGYLKFLYGDDEENKTTWENMIEEVKWNVGGWNTYSVTPKAMYEAEMTDGGCYNSNCSSYSQAQGSGTQVTAKVGLMYAHDYGFAATKNNWNTAMGSNYSMYSSNWLYNAVYEWTISRYSSGSHYAFYVDYGNLNSYNVYNSAYGVRPVLYLKSDVNIVTGEGEDGRLAAPYKVSLS